MPPEVTMTACAFNAKSPTTVRELFCPVRIRRLKDVAADTVDDPAGLGQFVDAMAKLEGDQAPLRSFLHALDKRRDQARTGAPGDVKSRHRIAMTAGIVAAALGPTDHREKADAAVAQPRSLFARRERDISLRPSARPEILVAIEGGRSHPVVKGELMGIVNAHATLFGKSTKKMPPNDQNAWPPSDCSGS